MTARDAPSWGATASARQADEAVRLAEVGKYPTCGRCACAWHGMKCKRCDCATSWTDEGMTA